MTTVLLRSVVSGRQNSMVVVGSRSVHPPDGILEQSLLRMVAGSDPVAQAACDHLMYIAGLDIWPHRNGSNEAGVHGDLSHYQR